MEQDQGMLLKHFCKLCDKSFPCGRSLGGHMRSHLISNPSETGERSRNSNSEIEGSVHTSYVLREKPKKTCKFAESRTEDTLLQNQNNRVCKECGKSFQSWKALFGHMKCHSEKVTISTNNKKKNHVGETDSWNVTDSHSDDSEAAKNAPNRKKRSRRATKRYQVNATTTNSSTLTAANSASPCVSENVEREQEEVAMSLIMLSRDVGSWGVFNSVTECSDNNSEFLGIRSSCQAAQQAANTESKAKQVRAEKLGSAEKLKKPKSRGSGIPISGGNKMKISEADKFKDSKLVDTVRFGKSEVDGPDNDQGSLEKKKRAERDDENEFWFSFLDSEKKNKFGCSTCNKTFHSYQALGGHRASHKKTKDSENATDQNNDHSPAPNQTSDSCEQSIQELADKVESSKKIKVAHHECPICFKIFPSGQALGGHKRSHLIAEAKTNQQHIQMQKPSVPEIRDFLDLNLPAPVEEEDEKSLRSVGFQAWWMMGSSYNHEQLVEPTF